MGFCRMQKNFAILSIVGMASLAVGGGQGISAVEAAKSGAGLRTVDIALKSGKLLASTPAGLGLYAVDTFSGNSTRVSSAPTASYGASLSPDGNLISFKSIDQAAGTQSPALYNITTGETTLLATSALAGTPAISASGQIAYTVGNTLYVQPLLGGGPATTFDLGHHVNLVAISPNGKKVAYNDENDQIIVIDLKKGARKVVTDGKDVYYGPQFSPDGKRILLQTLTGNVVITSNNQARVRILGAGETPAWLDKKTVSFTTKTVLEGAEVLETSLLAVTVGGKVKGVLASTSGDATAVARGGALAFAPAGQNTPSGFQAARGMDDGFAITSADLQVGLTSNGIAWTEPVSVKLEEIPVDTAAATTLDEPAAGAATRGVETRAVSDAGTYVYLTNTTFIHQVNDTPDWWNGHWSCNATAAIMGLQYYNTLPKKPITVNTPSAHTSDYGWYIPTTYTFNGRTYNKPSADPNGTIGYGGYGYITQNGWEDTKGHMAEFITYHGATSSVDWSPTMAKAKAEINANKPFVLLNSLTSAGHYILCIGYYKSQNTLIFNDPYGNKNTGYYPSNDGRLVRYDWPGYNNGYSNLNTVHCYVWCRKTTTAPPPTIVVDNSSSGFSASSSWSTGTSASDKYGSDYRFRSTAAASDPATWTFNITQAGKYRIDAWWTQGSNRAAAAPYILPDDTTVNKNQQSGGGAWQTLGTKTLSTGSKTVKLSCWTTAGFVVVADAIRVVPQF